MPRDGEKVRLALRAAALELMSERGYDATTAADIAAQAGVTERTFFRHFPDKREVLFYGGEELRDTMVEAIAQAPAQLSPLELLQSALIAAVPLLEANRSFAAPRALLAARTPALRERAGAKQEWLNAEVVAALEARGVAGALANLAVDVGMATFRRASSEWYDDPSEDLTGRVEQAFSDLHSLTGAL